MSNSTSHETTTQTQAYRVGPILHISLSTETSSVIRPQFCTAEAVPGFVLRMLFRISVVFCRFCRYLFVFDSLRRCWRLPVRMLENL